ncbi:MAG: hypothetical protein HY021_07415, partial [Burkholderiales bacterium]|nr:hypothetical protein [Burkholderiales bacterium]
LARLVARDASNLDFVGRLAFARISMATVAGLRGDPQAMRALLDAAEADLTRLLAADPRKLQWQLQLRANLALARESWAARVAPATPPTALQDTLAAAERLQAEGARLDPIVRRLLSDVELALGDRSAREGRHADAQRWWLAALDRLQLDSAETHPRWLTMRARLLLRLGRTQEARALADTVEASAYRAPMAADLFRRLAAAR